MKAHSNIPTVDRYRLGPLRDVRQIDERAKRNDLAVAVGDARATADDVSAAASRIAKAREVLAVARSATATLASAHLLTLADRYVARRRRDLDARVVEHEHARAAHAGKLGAIDAARSRWTAARADKQVIERHFERWRESQRKLADRRED
jgi:hypothetical protein